MKNKYKEFMQRVENALLDYLPEANCRLHEAMRYSSLNGGKRIRACLVYGLAHDFNYFDKQLDTIASAIEFIHAFTLIHDDLPAIDNDSLRRGKPSCHIVYGENVAILAGDALHALGYETILKASCSPEQQLAMLKQLIHATGYKGVIGGETIDVLSANTKITPELLQTMHTMKTGALIKACLMCGAIACNINQIEIKSSIEKLGYNIGLLFQIKDDLLDIEGNTEILGKTAHSDSIQNKPTYPSIFGFEESCKLLDKLHKETLELLRRLNITDGFLHYIVNYIVERKY